MTAPAGERRPLWFTALLLCVSGALIVTFVLLGNWQMRRLSWKLDLIETVEARAFGEPAALPGRFDPHQHSYLRVRVDGLFRTDKAVLVKAVTELGLGYWVMVPMMTRKGVLWINRGFVSPTRKDPGQWSIPDTPVTGLLRPAETGGTALEANDPSAGRWVSRDTVALSTAVGLETTLPYFLDADHLAAPDAWPRGGMTVVHFRNSHLPYALTWYAMALLFSGALVYVMRTHRREAR